MTPTNPNSTAPAERPMSGLIANLDGLAPGLARRIVEALAAAEISDAPVIQWQADKAAGTVTLSAAEEVA